MEGLFKFLIIITSIYVGFRIFFRYLFPLLLTWFLKRKLSQFQNNNPFFQQFNQQQEKEEDIKQPTTKSKKRFEKSSGEYVDFEEIK